MKAAFALGAFALLVAALMLFGAASTWWQNHVQQSQWPGVRATIDDCKLDLHRRRSKNLTPAWSADCAVTFAVDGKPVHGGLSTRSAYFEQRKSSWGNPGISELRAWVAQHPKGSMVNVHYDPSWPPTTQLDNPSDLFEGRPTFELYVAGWAGGIGVLLTWIGFTLLQRAR